MPEPAASTTADTISERPRSVLRGGAAVRRTAPSSGTHGVRRAPRSGLASRAAPADRPPSAAPATGDRGSSAWRRQMPTTTTSKVLRKSMAAMVSPMNGECGATTTCTSCGDSSNSRFGDIAVLRDRVQREPRLALDRGDLVGRRADEQHVALRPVPSRGSCCAAGPRPATTRRPPADHRNTG